MLVKTNGEWRPTLEWYARKSGEHLPLTNLYKKVSGSWEGIDIVPYCPHPDYLWLNFEIESNLVVDGSDYVTGWTDTQNGVVLTSYSSYYRPKLSPGSLLMGLSEPYFSYTKEGSYYRHHHLRKISGLTNPPDGIGYEGKTTTWAILAYIYPQSSGDIFWAGELSSGSPSPQAGLMVYNQKLYTRPNLSNVKAELGSPITGWNIIVFRAYYGNYYRISINGSAPINVNWDNVNWGMSELYLGASSTTASGSSYTKIAALMAWYGVVFSDKDYMAAHDYLLHKYGLN